MAVVGGVTWAIADPKREQIPSVAIVLGAILVVIQIVGK